MVHHREDFHHLNIHVNLTSYRDPNYQTETFLSFFTVCSNISFNFSVLNFPVCQTQLCFSCWLLFAQIAQPLLYGSHLLFIKLLTVKFPVKYNSFIGLFCSFSEATCDFYPLVLFWGFFALKIKSFNLPWTFRITFAGGNIKNLHNHKIFHQSLRIGVSW